MSQLNQESIDLGNALVRELFYVVKENETLFKNSSLDKILLKKKLKETDKLKVVRFCALALELYNCAQRFTDTYSKNTSQPVSPFTEMFLSSSFSKAKFDSFLKKFQSEVVFTAHPTEVFPLAVLKNLNRIEIFIEKLRTAKSPERKHRYLQALRANLTTLWLTDEIYREKPTPEDEANKLFYIFESSLWKATPYFFRRFYWEYKKYYDTSPKTYPKIKFSSWIGGDRDGNPFVTSQSSEKIITKSRRKVLRLILLELYPLRDELLIKSKQEQLTGLFPKDRYPYKALVADLVQRIQKTLKEELTLDVRDLDAYCLKRLKLAYKMLCKDGAKRVADRRLRSLIDRIESFGLSPFMLDLRQDSEIHTQIYEEFQLHTKKKQPSLKEAQKVKKEKLSEIAQDFFKTLSLAKSFKPCPFNCYIISMTRSVEDIKKLRFLLQLAGCPEIDVVPLFETPEDIRNAPAVLKNLQKTKRPLKQIMWGYSDSTKKGGRLSSAWNVYKVQKLVSKTYPELVHFHGRGGSFARGGGPLDAVFGLMPAKIVGHHFRQTFQGEVIQDDFGLPMRAVKSLERIFKESTLNYFKKELQEKEISKIEALSQKTEKTFVEGFYNSNKLNSLFESNSPISIINKLNLGSRPAKRKSKSKGVSYRAIPWVFAWAQTRAMLPLWYGLKGHEKSLLDLEKKSSFVKSFLRLSRLGLKNADPEIAKTYFYKNKNLCDDLKSVQSQILKDEPHKPEDLLRQKISAYLHKVQVESLKKPSASPLSLEIQKVTAQGIANYLGKSG